MLAASASASSCDHIRRRSIERSGTCGHADDEAVLRIAELNEAGEIVSSHTGFADDVTEPAARAACAWHHLRGDRESHHDLDSAELVCAQLPGGRQRLDHDEADAAPRVGIVDRARADAGPVVPYEHLELARVERDLDVHRTIAAAIGVRDDVVGGLADGRLDVLERPPQIDRVTKTSEHLADERDVLRPCGEALDSNIPVRSVMASGRRFFSSNPVTARGPAQLLRAVGQR